MCGGRQVVEHGTIFENVQKRPSYEYIFSNF